MVAAANGSLNFEFSTEIGQRGKRAFGRILAREIRVLLNQGLAASQLVDHILLVDANTGDESLHRIIPLARCSICGGASAFPPKPTALHFADDDAPERVLDALFGWVDSRTGVISGVYLEPSYNGQDDLPYTAIALPPNVVDVSGSLRRLSLGWGKGLTKSSAIVSAVGEAIERYSASLPDINRILWARLSELDGQILDPRSFALYADAQYKQNGFPFVRFNPETQQPWVLGKWLHNGADVWVPAVMAFLSLTVHPENLIVQGSSNGLAASTDIDEASLRAILELIERDAFMATWLAGRPGHRIKLDNHIFDPLLWRVIQGLERLGATVELYVLPTCVYGTTVLCLGLGDGVQYPGATIGLGCDLDVQLAVKQAILELGQTGPFLRRMMRAGHLSVPSEPSEVQEMLHHAAYYFSKERVNLLDRIRYGGGNINLRDITNNASGRSLFQCASDLKTLGIRVALIDVTSSDVATGPFRVMRAVSPDLQNIWYGYGLEYQPVERIRKLGVIKGIPVHPIM
jgi:ribosomal protein S12 methylthiotransferase accessory factor